MITKRKRLFFDIEIVVNQLYVWYICNIKKYNYDKDFRLPRLLQNSGK